MMPDFASLDDALDSLRRPGDVEARLAALRAIVEHWHGPIAPEDGFSDADLAGLTLPMPLARWYRWGGAPPRDHEWAELSLRAGRNALRRPQAEGAGWEARVPHAESGLLLLEHAEHRRRSASVRPRERI
ncbi:MAG: hypothetical protein OTI36_03590 [Beijerinckiaceae bacterium]|nr:hypothetical protein [Beijerinckiaceae bacterium]